MSMKTSLSEESGKARLSWEKGVIVKLEPMSSAWK